MTKVNAAETPNLGRDLRRIHQAITRGLQVATEAGSIYTHEGYPDDAMREGFLRYVRALVALLDAHNVGEDDVAWPVLREKIPDAPYARLRAEHQEIAETLARVRAALDEDDKVILAPLLKLQDQWDEHRSREELSFSPEVAAGALTSAEQLALQTKLAAHWQARAQPSELVIPFLLYNLPAAERKYLLPLLPPAVVKEQLPGPWQAEWGVMRPFLLMSVAAEDG